MSEFFLKIVNMSISASWIVLAVLLLRLLLKKAPKWINVVLWGIVGLRLVMPFSLESVFSLIPSAETVSPQIMTDKTPQINTGVPVINNVINPVISESFSPAPMDSANPLQIWIPILSILWIIGVLALIVYTAVSYWRVKRKIGTAVLLRDNIFQSETVVSPFVLGVIKPKIYLPFKMAEQDMEHVIAHEQAHIKRKDHLWKPLGFLLLTIHWFNPLMWLGYVLLCRDIELACDEKVVKEFDNEQKADYSQALLTCSVNRRIIAACPLAFGEVGVKKRVKSVLNYKKPAFWIIVVAVVASVVVAVCFLTNPITADKPDLNSKDNQGTEIIKFKMIDEEHLGDYQISSEYYDTKVTSQNFKIVLEATRGVTNFRFIELDESEELKVGDTLFELETLKANSPVLLHTYINDAVLNRGISYQDDNGVVRYLAFDYNLNNGSVSLSEVYPENENYHSTEETYDPYPLLEITDERIVKSQSKKKFNDIGISLTFPLDWKCFERHGEDGRAYFFQDAELGDECRLIFSIMAKESVPSDVYLNERTKSEYSQYLSEAGYKDAKINSFTKEKVGGYNCTKVVFTYSKENKKYTQIDFGYIVDDVRLCDLTIIYPTNESDTYEDIFDSIINSVEFSFVNTQSSDLSDKKLVKIVAKELGVPENANITYKVSEKFFWEASEDYYKNVTYYENGDMVASASVNPQNGELLKNILKYSDSQ